MPAISRRSNVLKTDDLAHARERFNAEQNAEIDQEVEQLSRALTLRQVREIVGISQVEAANAINTSQSEISKIEARNDVKVSTLVDYIEAIGGELEILAHINGVPYTIIIPSMLGHEDAA